LSRRARRASWLPLAALMLAAACDLTVDVNALGNGQCPEGRKPCASLGQCVPLDRPETGCGDPNSCAPCALPHASATCDAGACAIDSCLYPYKDCDPSKPGCESDVQHDPEHCGDCPNVCHVENGFPGCSGGMCTVGGCDFGYTDCEGTLTDRCAAVCM
jgi:hypothetical protein